LFLGENVFRGTLVRGTFVRGTFVRGTFVRGTLVRGTFVRGKNVEPLKHAMIPAEKKSWRISAKIVKCLPKR
jgi:hypothetical protein